MGIIKVLCNHCGYQFENLDKMELYNKLAAAKLTSEKEKKNLTRPMTLWGKKLRTSSGNSPFKVLGQEIVDFPAQEGRKISNTFMKSANTNTKTLQS